MKPVICLMRTFPQYFKNHVFEVKHKLQFWGKNVEQTHHVKILLLLPEKKKMEEDITSQCGPLIKL